MGGGSLSSGNPWLITQAGKNSGLVRPTTFLRLQRFCAERGKERWRGSVSGDPRTPATIPAALWVGDSLPQNPGSAIAESLLQAQQPRTWSTISGGPDPT